MREKIRKMARIIGIKPGEVKEIALNSDGSISEMVRTGKCVPPVPHNFNKDDNAAEEEVDSRFDILDL